jgi:arsenite methyltransferase
MSTTAGNDVREEVRAKYAEAALRVDQPEAGGCGCGTSSCCSADAGGAFGEARYSQGDREALPTTAVAASLGCGNPTAVADLAEGEVVLDLGSGGGIDVLLSARRVGPPAGRTAST